MSDEFVEIIIYNNYGGFGLPDEILEHFGLELLDDKNIRLNKNLIDFFKKFNEIKIKAQNDDEFIKNVNEKIKLHDNYNNFKKELCYPKKNNVDYDKLICYYIKLYLARADNQHISKNIIDTISNREICRKIIGDKVDNIKDFEDISDYKIEKIPKDVFECDAYEIDEYDGLENLRIFKNKVQLKKIEKSLHNLIINDYPKEKIMDELNNMYTFIRDFNNK